MRVPNPTEESDQNALPDPELNPLLNPLLAAHMGRWAEVYFTTPPERRGQAIADLLKELESTSPPQLNSQVLVDEASTQTETENLPDAETLSETEREATQAPDSPPRRLESVCSLCGHSNREEQKFCGMCGSRLDAPSEETISEIDEFRPSIRAIANDPVPSFDADSLDPAIEADYRFAAPAEKNESEDLAWLRASNRSTNDIPHFRNEVPHFAQHVPRFADDAPSSAAERSGVPYRYRLYVGVGLAILLVALIYMARRGTGALSDAAQSPPSRVIPAAQPGPATPRPATPEPAVATGSDGGEEKLVDRTQEPLNPIVPAAKPANSHKRAISAPPALPIAPMNASPSSAPAEFSGADDLAMAEKYLNGNQGRARDSKEAAQLLWKAVGKGNPAATIVLSDLYLRGDGVPKSCDQARLLLDAAARKGVKSAADRLRNLQAFGCQ
jgi:TPR repeat protein